MGCRKVRYQIIAQLNEGGAAVIYLAMDTFRNESVAIKMPKPVKKTRMMDLGTMDSRIEMILKEIEVLQKLNHPNVVRFIDCMIHEGQQAVVMEWIDGQNLTGMIRSPRQYNMGTKMLWVEQLCQGVDFVNGQGIIHADLKPDNLMISKNCLKIVDFGISHILGDPETEIVYWHTPKYSAPEQLRREVEKYEMPGRNSATTDVFTTGVITFELLTGVHPFSASTRRATESRILQGRFTEKIDYSGLNLKREKWNEVFARVFEPEPEERYSCAMDFFEDLLGCFHSEKKEYWAHRNVNGLVFRSPEDHFGILDEMEEVREFQWDRFKKDLNIVSPVPRDNREDSESMTGEKTRDWKWWSTFKQELDEDNIGFDEEPTVDGVPQATWQMFGSDDDVDNDDDDDLGLLVAFPFPKK